MKLLQSTAAFALTAIVSACSGGTTSNVPGSSGTVGAAATSGLTRSAQGTQFGVAPAALTIGSGFKVEVIGNVAGARELVVAPNGDLLVGTEGQSVALITNADGVSGSPGAARTLVTLPEGPAAGVGIGYSNTMYVSTEHAVWKLHYAPGDVSESNPQQIAALRTGPVSGTDGDIHRSTSVEVMVGNLYVSVGSSCNACTEVDPGRAAIIKMGLNGENAQVYARHVRNAIAMASNPHSWFLWAGGAGQDNLPVGHPYEYFDAITQHPAGSSWGWPNCEEHNIAYTQGANCAGMIVPHVVLPAYSTIIGASFYPLASNGRYAFPASYRGGLFLSAHGSWHTDSAGIPLAVPQVVYVPMNAYGWDAQTPVNWANPKAQYTTFLGGFEAPGSAVRTGRPTGVGVGPQGSLFVGDDQTGNIYRIRPM